ncbi:MAG: SnoaL-like domain-containing protein [Actinobacteria bacterium]|nr:SnoaL-like domain-containing protein [Actinomycetota bacterium]
MTNDISLADIQNLISAWWFNYDNGDLEHLAGWLTSDTVLSVRTDSGTTDFEEFIRADEQGRDAVAAWHIQHRDGSPYPLRHHGTNVHVTGTEGDDVQFASYIYVTHNEGISPVGLPSGIVRGAVRREDGVVRLSAMHVVLDMTASVAFADRPR